MLKIPVFLSSDDKYSPFVATTIASILANTKEFIEFYILNCGISEENIKKISNMKNKFNNFSIEFINIDINKYFNNFPERQFISKAMYARYLIPILKPEVKKAIYSDTDVAFVSDIKILYNENLSDKPLGAVPSQRGKLNNNYKDTKEALGLSKEHKYLMSGLLLIDCEKWRNENYTEKLLQETKKWIGTLNLPDQEIFNIVFDNNYKELDKKYCVIYKIFNDVYDKNEITELKKNQVIIHYPGANEWKPWNNKKLKSAKYFWKYVCYTNFEREINLIYKNFQCKKHHNSFLNKVKRTLNICFILSK